MRASSPPCAKRSRCAGWWSSGTSRNQPGSKAIRESPPLGLLYGNRAFLVASSDWGKEPRLWRVANVSELRISDETFERDPDFDLARYAKRSFGTFQEEPVEVFLRFAPGAARDASTFVFHPNQTTEPNDDGSLTVRFKAGGINEMCWHLFTWGGSVTIESPLRLRRRLSEMSARLAAHHLGAPQRLPVRRPVARAGEAGGIDERLGEHGRMPMDLAHVAREPAHALAQHPRGEVHNPLRLGQDHEPRVVRNQMQAPELLLGQPPDPLIARAQLERVRLPTDQRKPALAQHRDVSHAAPHKGAKGQVVMGAHQFVPALALAGPHGRTHRHLAQSLGNRAEHRLDLVPPDDARV